MTAQKQPHHVKALIKDLPTESGIYQMLDSNGSIIYIGKAKNIKKRVSQYFLPTRDFKTHVLVDHIHAIKPIITKSEHEALLLENQLIKQHKPRFNVLLKDDKTYPYIKVTVQDPFPKIIITRHKKADGAKYFGPYTSIGSTRKLRQVLLDLFPIRDCKQAIDAVTKQKKCIQLDLGKCIGPCIYKDVKPQYDHYIQQCLLFLDGKRRDILDALTEEMTALSNEQNYEKAAIVRNKRQLLTALQEQHHVDLDTNNDHFVIGCSTNERFHYVVCQHFQKNCSFLSMGIMPLKPCHLIPLSWLFLTNLWIKFRHQPQ